MMISIIIVIAAIAASKLVLLIGVLYNQIKKERIIKDHRKKYPNKFDTNTHGVGANVNSNGFIPAFMGFQAAICGTVNSLPEAHRCCMKSDMLRIASFPYVQRVMQY